MESYTLRDSGERQQFDTGAVRDTNIGKGRFDLLPWHGIREVARVMELGASKYAARNWEKGMPLSRFLDSATRHIADYLEGDRKENHIAQAAWNLLCFLSMRHWIKEGVVPSSLGDIPHYEKPEKKDGNSDEYWLL